MQIGEGVVATLYYGTATATPKWLQVLSANTASPLEDLQTSTASGVLLACVNQRYFVLTFGHSWQRVKHSGIEPNFGIRCVLNLAKADSLRAIRRDRVAEASIQAIEQIPDSDEINRFGMDVEKDLLRGVKAKIEESLNFGAWVAGADSFKASIDPNAESIGAYLLRCFALWTQDTYKANFAWIDNIAPIRDRELEDKLTDKLVERLKAKDPALTLCVPDLLAWDDHDLFSFERKKLKQAPCANHLELAQWVEFALSADGDITPESLIERSIFAYRTDGTLLDKWEVKRCVHGLVYMDGHSYLAHGGNWFEIDSDFVARTNKKIDAIPSASVSLPKTTIDEKEGVYNERASKESGGKMLLMDRKLIYHGGGQSKFEVCDLFTEDGQLICVKPWGGESGGLSHLFLQARNSVELINNDPAYRSKVRSYIAGVAPGFVLSWDYICDEPKEAEVVLAILRGCAKEALPFFAKLSLIGCVEDLRKMRFKATYLVINA